MGDAKAPAGPNQKAPAGLALSALESAARDALELVGAALGVAAFGVFVATLIVGRTALFWPSLAWAATAGLTALGLLALWWAGAWANRRAFGLPTSPTTPGDLAGRTDQNGQSTPSLPSTDDPAAQPSGRARHPTRLHREHQARRRAWRLAGWPLLVLLIPAVSALAAYVDEPSNHFLGTYLPTRQQLLAYGVGWLTLAQGCFWTATLVRMRLGTGWCRWGQRDTARFGVMVLLVGFAAAAYLNASVFQQWFPRQIDLHINLAGAQDLLEGRIPYRQWMPVWSDRVHLLPVTVLFLFGPLAVLPEDVARLLFFFANQALWLVAMGLLVLRLAPPAQRFYWMAGVLMLGATYWPWQETIRYGQQDGLLILLFALSLLAVASGRERWAGVALGVALVVKPISIWLPLVYLLHGKWRALLAAGLMAGALAVASVPVIGLDSWRHYVQVELPELLPGTVRGTSMPITALHARMFVGREALGDGQPAPRFLSVQAMNLAANAIGLLALLRIVRRPAPDGLRVAATSRSEMAPADARNWYLDVSLGLTLTLLLAPLAWQHYASWLTIAFLLLASPAVWRGTAPIVRVPVAILSGLAYLLLSLEDARLLALLAPVVERWPGMLSFYAAGLLALAGALALARLTPVGSTEVVMTPEGLNVPAASGGDSPGGGAHPAHLGEARVLRD